MKKALSLFCLISFLLLLVGCNNSEELSNTDNSATKSEEVSKTDNSVTKNENSIEYSLDAEYTEAINFCSSNVETCNTNSEFAQKWYDLSEYYYECIMQTEFLYNGTKKKESVTTIHSAWKQYAKHRCEAEQKRLESIYESGTIVSIKLSQYEYDLYRLHAIEMYDMCLQLHVDCVRP